MEQNNLTSNKQQQTARPEPALLPPVDVVEDASGITLFADLPGVPKDKLNLHLEADSLTIEGEVALDAAGGPQSASAWMAAFTVLAAAILLGPMALYWSRRTALQT